MWQRGLSLIYSKQGVFSFDVKLENKLKILKIYVEGPEDVQRNLLKLWQKIISFNT